VQACKDDLPDGHSEIFFALRLDTPNQVELPEENSFSAHAVTPVPGRASRATFAGIATDLPVGQSSPC
jgi:hypothetical protein